MRFHHMDSAKDPALFDKTTNDTQHLDAETLDRLDYLVFQFQQRGIYANLNLNTSRRFKAGDNVRDYQLLGIGKSATYFNPRLVELQQSSPGSCSRTATRIPSNEYRHEPAVAVVEIVNENSVLEGWVDGPPGGQGRARSLRPGRRSPSRTPRS